MLWIRRLRGGAVGGDGMGGVQASVKAILQRARHDGAAAAAGEPCDVARGRDRLLVEMEAAFVGAVEITTCLTPQGLRVEVRFLSDGEPSPGGEGDC